MFAGGVTFKEDARSSSIAWSHGKEESEGRAPDLGARVPNLN